MTAGVTGSSSKNRVAFADRMVREAMTRRCQPLGVTNAEIGVTDFPGAGLPISTRSSLTISPVWSLKDLHGFGIRPKYVSGQAGRWSSP